MNEVVKVNPSEYGIEEKKANKSKIYNHGRI